MITGAAAGFAGGIVGGGATQIATSLTQNSSLMASVGARSGLILAVGTIGGALSGAAAAALSTLVTNYQNSGKLDTNDFLKYLHALDFGYSLADLEYLNKEILKLNITKDEQISHTYKENIQLLDSKFDSLKPSIIDLFDQLHNVFRNVKDNAYQGLVIGGVTGAITQSQ